MARVDPPPQVVPGKFRADPELAPYFTYLNRVVFDLWKRTGGGGDLIEGGAQLTADQEFSGANTFSGSFELDGITIVIDGVQVLGPQLSAVADAAAATASNPAPPTAFTAPAAGAIPVVSDSAGDLTTVADALETLRDEVAAYEVTISALIVDVADVRAQLNTALARMRSHGIIDT